MIRLIKQYYPLLSVIVIAGSCVANLLPRRMECDRLIQKTILQKPFEQADEKQLLEYFGILQTLDSVSWRPALNDFYGTMVQADGIRDRMPQSYRFHFQGKQLIYIEAEPTVYIRGKAVFPTIERVIQCVGKPQYYEAYHYQKKSTLLLWYPDKQVVAATGIVNYQDYTTVAPPHYDGSENVTVIYYSQGSQEGELAKALHSKGFVAISKNPVLERQIQKQIWPDSVKNIESVELKLTN